MFGTLKIDARPGCDNGVRHTMNVAIIPARGGSKRIPGKNIKLFCGKPMIAHSIISALDSGIIDEVIVSTDDEQIAQTASDFGATVPFMRPAELADDYTGTRPVMRHAVQALFDSGRDITHVACIYATAPLLPSSIIRKGFEMLVESNSDYVFTAAQFSFPIQRAIMQTPSGGVTPFDNVAIAKRSQDLPDAFHDAGQLYWGKADIWLDPSSAIFGENSQMIVLPSHRVQDIDTPEDWQRAELLYMLLQKEGHR